MKFVPVVQEKNSNIAMDRFNNLEFIESKFPENSSIYPVEVSIGILINPSNQILLTRRSLNLHQGGLWEFPGGKIEQGETTEEALRRELLEELSITIHQSIPLITIDHHYSDTHVLLHANIITDYSGEPKICDGQLDLQWVSLQSLNDENYPLPAANLQIMQELQKVLIGN